jgi:hypothetical protein
VLGNRLGAGQIGFDEFFCFLQQWKPEPLPTMVINAVEEDLKQPGAAIRARLEPVKRFPSLEVNLLRHVFSSRFVSQYSSGRAENVVQVRQRFNVETICGGTDRPRCPSGDTPLLKIVIHPILGSAGACHMPQMPYSSRFIPGVPELFTKSACSSKQKGTRGQFLGEASPEERKWQAL